MSDGDGGGEGSRWKTWAGFQIRCMEWCTVRVGLQVELETVSDVTVRTRIKSIFKDNLQWCQW